MRVLRTSLAVVALGLASSAVAAKEKIPALLWGADLTAIQCIDGGICQSNGVDAELVLKNSIDEQISDIQSGKTGWFRGTLSQAVYANDRLCESSDHCLVHAYQYSDSTGGDGLLVQSGLTDVSDLCGKTIGLQKAGPHIDLAATIEQLAKCPTGNEIQYKWYDDLGMDSANDASALHGFQRDEVDAAMGITVELEGLNKGSVLVSTATLRDSIKDSLFVTARKASDDPQTVSAVTHALLLANEQTIAMAKAADSKWNALINRGAGQLFGTPDDPEFAAIMGDMYKLDLTMARWTGNAVYATCETADGKRSLTCMNNTVHEKAEFLERLGLISDPVRAANIQVFVHDWEDLKSGLTEKFGVKAPVMTASQARDTANMLESSGRINESFKPEVIYFSENDASALELADYEHLVAPQVDKMASAAGSITTINAHVDPINYLLKKYGTSILPASMPEGARKYFESKYPSGPSDPAVWKEVLTAAQVASQKRADAVLRLLQEYVERERLDVAIHTVVPKGLSLRHPLNGQCTYMYQGRKTTEPCFPDSKKMAEQNRRTEFATHVIEVEVALPTGEDW